MLRCGAGAGADAEMRAWQGKFLGGGSGKSKVWACHWHTYWPISFNARHLCGLCGLTRTELAAMGAKRGLRSQQTNENPWKFNQNIRVCIFALHSPIIVFARSTMEINSANNCAQLHFPRGMEGAPRLSHNSNCNYNLYKLSPILWKHFALPTPLPTDTRMPGSNGAHGVCVISINAYFTCSATLETAINAMFP